MNFLLILKLMGVVLKTEAILMILPILISVLYASGDGIYFIYTAIPLFIRKGAIHHTNNCSDCRKHSLITLQLRKRIENYHHSALCLSRSSVKRIISSTHPSMPSIAESRDSE